MFLLSDAARLVGEKAGMEEESLSGGCFGSTDRCVGQVRPGSAGRWRPRLSMAKAMRAWLLWKPKATRVSSRILVLTDSMRPLDRPCSMAARMRGR